MPELTLGSFFLSIFRAALVLFYLLHLRCHVPLLQANPDQFCGGFGAMEVSPAPTPPFSNATHGCGVWCLTDTWYCTNLTE